MLSNQKLWPALADGFVGVRLDWEQGNHYRDKFGFVLGTGDQLLLKPNGELIPPQDGKRVYGRHGEDISAKVLKRARSASKSTAEIKELKIEWFLWPRKPSAKRQTGFYPPPVDAIAQYARLPIAEIEGPVPEALRDREILRKHVRQFIWKRGRPDGESTVRIRRVRDGLPDELNTDLAVLRGEQLEADALGAALDRAWLAYMKDRPLTSRGYLENKHGGWMRKVAPQMLDEDQAIRARASEGTLLPPGRWR